MLDKVYVMSSLAVYAITFLGVCGQVTRSGRETTFDVEVPVTGEYEDDNKPSKS